MHSLICGLWSLAIISAIMAAITSNALVSFLLGATVAMLCGMQCYKMKSVQAFVLGILLGTVATDILYVLIRLAVTLGHAELTKSSKVLMNIIISLTIGFISCAHPKKAIVQYTAIVGASMMPAGALMLAGLTEYN